MTTPTTNYGWGMPADGGDFDNWGVELNTAIGAIDSQVHANDAAARGYASAAQSTAQGSSLQKAQNLSDLGSVAAAWGNLGVVITTNTNGSYIKIGPLLVQWGSAIGNSTSPRNLPASFSDYTRAQIITGNSDQQGANNDVAFAYLLSNSTYYFGTKQTNGGSAESGYPGSWIAIGPA